MVTHPNNTLAQYITNLPHRISLSGAWECGLTEIHYPHDWYNVRNARLMVEHAGKSKRMRILQMSTTVVPRCSLGRSMMGSKVEARNYHTTR